MTTQLRKACEKAIDCCNTHRLTVEFLEQLAKVEPAFADRAAELRSKLDHTQEVSEAALNLMDMAGN